TRAHVGGRGAAGGELDGGVGVAQRARGDAATVLVRARIDHGGDRPAVRRRQLLDGAPHPAMADDRQPRGAHASSGRRSKNSAWRARMASPNRSASMMMVRLISVALSEIMCTRMP